MGITRAVLLALAFLLAFPAPAQQTHTQTQTLYRLVDKSGRVTYVDKVPKNFEGEVRRMDIETDSPPSRSPRSAAPASPAAVPGDTAPAADMATRRRKLRERLQAVLDVAHEKLAAAKKALADGSEPGEDEYQTIQQRSDASGAKEGDKGPRPNCTRQSGNDGKPIWMCSTIVPGEAFYARQKSLEDKVREAEAEVAAAERAYRRNVD